MITTSTIYNNTKTVNEHNGMLDMAMEVAAFLDQIGAFAFKNWIDGEVIDGPKRDKFFIKIKLMFPTNVIPDPSVIERLENLKCKTELKKDIYRRVIHVRERDTDQMNNRNGFEKRLVEHNVWVLTLMIPERYLPLDGNTVFKIDDEYHNYNDLEAIYINNEKEQLETEDSDIGGDEGGFDL